MFIPYGKMNNIFYFEATNMIEPKLYINDHCMGPYKVAFETWMWYSRWPPTEDLGFNIELYWENE
jgi:hypothetical protein